MLISIGRSVATGLAGFAGLSLTANRLSNKAAFSVMAQQDPTKASSIYEFSAQSIDGAEVSLEKYKGKVCVIVNVASKWGKTKVNYTQLVELYDKYSSEDGGLAVLAFPCNQFGGQEPGTNEEIKAFAAGYDVKFDMFEKINVNGSDAHPLFKYLKAQQGGMLIDAIKWNFTKFVVDKNGIPVARYGPTDDPIPKVENEVKKLL